MDKLRAIKFFVRISQLRSFTKVADEFGLGKSIVSKEISRLEENLGAKLLYRSTRCLSLTPIGETYLLACEEVLAVLGNAESYASSANVPSGVLKVNGPMSMGLTSLNAITSAFIERYPEVKLEIYLSDQSLDLVEMGFDVALRMVSKEFDSSYVGVLLAKFSYAVCAGKNYFEKHSKINVPNDLKYHNCFEYTYFRNKSFWPVEGVAKARA